MIRCRLILRWQRRVKLIFNRPINEIGSLLRTEMPSNIDCRLRIAFELHFNRLLRQSSQHFDLLKTGSIAFRVRAFFERLDNLEAKMH